MLGMKETRKPNLQTLEVGTIPLSWYNRTKYPTTQHHISRQV